MTVIFVHQTRVRRLQIFRLRKARMPCDFPPAVVFATSTSGRFVKLKVYKIKL